MSSCPLVLVTGVHGFVASNVTKVLLESGYRVRGSVRSLSDSTKVQTLRSLFGEELELCEADLIKDQGWDEAVKGCTYVLHVASPLPRGPPKDEQQLIRPAVEGTKRVMSASAKSGTVRRVVLTSSISSVRGEDTSEKGRLYNENDWSDPSCPGMEAYSRSKTLAELAAWEVLATVHREGGTMELSVVNPGLVLGPPLTDSLATSLDVVKSMIAGWNGGMTAPLHCCLCDVRDLAQAHLRAMTLPEAAGQRHIIATKLKEGLKIIGLNVITKHKEGPKAGTSSKLKEKACHFLYRNFLDYHVENVLQMKIRTRVSTRCAWMIELCSLLSRDLSPLGYSLPTRTAPIWAIWLCSFFDGGIRLVYRRMGQEFRYDNSRMRQVLNIQPRDLRVTLLDTANALFDLGLLPDKRVVKH